MAAQPAKEAEISAREGCSPCRFLRAFPFSRYQSRGHIQRNALREGVLLRELPGTSRGGPEQV